MKYFLDTEFLEGPQKEKFPISLFRKNTPPTIDLISIGVVAEDGREYYAISKDFNLGEAWNRFQLEEQSGDMRNIFPEGKKVYWIRENVLKTIWRDLFFQADDCSGLSNKQTEQFFQDVNSGGYDHYFSFKSLKALIDKYGKTNKEIALDLLKFCRDEVLVMKFDGKLVAGIDPIRGNPEFYAYFADYDWVVFCWLFGKMMDLPDGFPMYCNDLKQELDSLVRKQIAFYVENKRPEEKPSFEAQLNYLKTKTDFPKQENEHSAIDDARWNKKLFEFLNKL